MHHSKVARKPNHLNNNGSLPISKQKFNNKNHQEFDVIVKEEMREASPASTEQQLASQLQKQLQPNKRIPLPITQTKLTQTHCNLQQIPLVIYVGANINKKDPISRSTSLTKRQDRNQKIMKEINKDYNPQKIRELYLSHNHIRTVKNKLRYFVSLKNLNLSYNLLTDVQEFIQEVMGTYEQLQPSMEYNSVGSVDINLINSFQTFGPRLRQKINKDKLDIGLKKDKISLCLKMLYLRMNKFPYGFQDNIIKNVVSLERYEDYFFKQVSNKKVAQSYSSKNMNEYQDKALIFQLGNKVSEYFIPAMSKLKEVQQELTILYESLFNFQDSSMKIGQNRMREEAKIYRNLLQLKYEKIVIKLCQYLTNKKKSNGHKQQKYLPKSRLGTLSKLLEYEGLCLQLQQFLEEKKCKINNRFYLGQGIQNETNAKDTNDRHKKMAQRTAQIFTETVRNILTKFANRNNNELVKTLQAQKSIYKHGNKGMTDLANAMGGYFKAQHYKIFESNPGKYLEKIDNKCIQQHPYMDYMKYKIQQKQKKKSNNDEVFTLDGNRHKTKNTIVRNLNRFADHHKQQPRLHNSSDSLDLFDDHSQFDNEEGYYQKMPIIIFQRNYLQVVTQIWDENLRQFVKIYDITFNQLSNMEKNINKEANGQKLIKIQMDEQDMEKNNLNTIRNIRYMQDPDQQNDQNDLKMEQFYLDKRKLSIYHNQYPQGQQSKEFFKNNDKRYTEGNMNLGQSDDYQLTFSFDEDKQNSKTKTNAHNRDQKSVNQVQFIKIQELKSGKKDRVKQPQKQNQRQEDKTFKEYEERKTIPKFYNISKSIEHDRKKSYQQKKIDNIYELNAQATSNERNSYISQKINNLGEKISRAKQQKAENSKKQKQSLVKGNKKIRLKSKNSGALQNIDCDVNYREDLQKYSIYQINLAYKKNRNKQKKKKAKRQLDD